ncbi:MAG TPA: hypothetical protein VNG53_07110, partial [Bacteroidia bacterium]|nr:hypothetical protein [Bacteroidia bacterium]
WSSLLSKVNQYPKKIIGFAVLVIFLIVLLFYFLFSSPSPSTPIAQQNNSQTTIPEIVTQRKTDSISVTKNIIPQKQIPVIEQNTKAVTAPLSEKPISNNKIVIKKNILASPKPTMIAKKSKTDSALMKKSSVEKPVADSNFNFVESVKNNQTSELLALPKDTVSNFKKHKSLAKKSNADSTKLRQ